MNLRFIERDGKKILQVNKYTTSPEGAWYDVPHVSGEEGRQHVWLDNQSKTFMSCEKCMVVRTNHTRDTLCPYAPEKAPREYWIYFGSPTQVLPAKPFHGDGNIVHVREVME